MLVAGGLAPAEEEREAIARFGDARTIARGWNRDAPSGGAAATFRGLLGAVGLLAAVGLVTVGVSAAAAYLLSRVTSVQQVFGLPAGSPVSAAPCAHWMP